jgi:hypothetical protein
MGVLKALVAEYHAPVSVGVAVVVVVVVVVVEVGVVGVVVEVVVVVVEVVVVGVVIVVVVVEAVVVVDGAGADSTGVGSEVAIVEPFLFVAVTARRKVPLTSPESGEYVCPPAPPSPAHPPPLESHFNH